MNSFLHRCLTRTPLIGVLMAALVFRALIPAGFMPTHAGNGSIAMELCSGFGAKSIVVELGAADESSSSGTQLFEHAPCGFAAIGLSMPPAETLAFPISILLHSAPEAADTSLTTSPSIRRSQSPRAPPLT